MIQPKTYIRKAFTVDCERVTEKNLRQMAEWCGGEVKGLGEHDGRWGPFIEVPVVNPDTKKPRQSQAFVGDWILQSEQGFKVYTDRAFLKNFDSAEDHARSMAEIIRKESVNLLDQALGDGTGERIQATYGVVVGKG